VGEITYQGDAPFSLPTAQSARADAVGGTVEVVVFVNVPGRATAPVPIRIPMLHKTAKLLAEELGKAAINAEIKDIRG
jgi:hypothetical protein